MAFLKKKKEKTEKKPVERKVSGGLDKFYDAYLKGMNIKKGKHNVDAHGIDNVVPVCDLCSRYMKGAKTLYEAK